MTTHVPKLEPRRPGRTAQLLALVSRGTREVTRQIKPYTAWWDEQNQAAIDAAGPLLAVIGDSTAIGIGASAPSRGYVGLVHARLSAHHQRPWRVINLAQSGARLSDAIDRQLPALSTLSPDLVICCIGTNDLVWGRDTARLRRRLIAVTTELPTGSLVATLAGMSPRARLANGTIKAKSRELDLVAINPWSEPGPGPHKRVANDRFHPNDLGYELMAKAFSRRLGVLAPGEAAERPSPPVPD